MTTARPLLVLKTGESYRSIIDAIGDFEDWIQGAITNAELDVEVVDVRNASGAPNIEQFCGAIITGSHAMVTQREPWAEKLMQWAAEAARLGFPLLGICYGHQLLAKALGGDVGYRPQGPEIGTVTVSLTASARTDPLFLNIPDPFLAQTFHWQSVLSLPEGAVLLARSDEEPCHAFRYGACAWGVQFHPEYSGAVMRAHIAHIAKGLITQDTDPYLLERMVRETGGARSMLSAFADFASTRDAPTG